MMVVTYIITPHLTLPYLTTTHLTLPCLLAELSGVTSSSHLEAYLLVWSMVSGLCIIDAGIAVCATKKIFPVPFTLSFCAILTIVTLPGPRWGIPQQQMIQAEFRRKVFYSGLCMLMVLVVLVFLPCLNAGMKQIQTSRGKWWPQICIVGFLISRLVLQRVGRLLCNMIGPDGSPCYIWFAACAYEMNMAFAISHNFNFMIPAELLFINLTDNVYHIYSLHRNAGQAGVERYISSQLMIRQVLAMIVPIHFLCFNFLMYYVPWARHMSDIVCQIDCHELMIIQGSEQTLSAYALRTSFAFFLIL